MKFVIYRRDFSELVVQPELDIEVDNYSWAAIGGPKEARITATGDRAQLYSLLNHLRAPVEILNDLGEAVWWGYINAVNINWDGIGFGCDLDSMSNDVAVAYTADNMRFTTQWSSDADSVAEYGEKELLLTMAEATATDALQRRDTYLAGAKYPIPILTTAGARSGSCRITCRGWLDTLEWKYYTNATGKESYEADNGEEREIGEDDRPIMAQSFQIGATTAWTATSIWLPVRKEGAPSDNLVVSLYSDVAGSPGVSLASGLKAGADIDTYSEWVEFTLSASYELQPSTTYWIHVARSGAVDAANFFFVGKNTDAGYSRGSTKVYNTNLSAWVDESAWHGDMLFRVMGVTETTDQITALVTACGQFLNGTIIENESGVSTNPYRNGDSTALYELEQLLLTGTTNDRRLLCEVTPERYLRVYEEPARPDASTASYALGKGGVLMTQYLTLVEPEYCPVGVWCHLADVIPATVDLSIIADPNLFLIEEASYNPARGEYHIDRTRNQSEIWNIGGAVQG